MPEIDWVKRVEELSDRLFDQVNCRTRDLAARVSSLKNKIKELDSTINRITSDPNKPIKLVSPQNYPMLDSFEIRQPPVEFEGIKVEGKAYLVPRMISSSQLTFENCDAIEQATRRQLDRVGELIETLKFHHVNQNKCSLNNITSVSSLLVFHSYESRFLTGGRAHHSSKQYKSIASESSLHEYGARSTIQRHKTLTNADPSKSSSGEEISRGQDLGPVPDSILKYHQESFLEPDTLDAFDLTNYDEAEDDDGNMITGGLPDILPSLSGIVRDVHKTSPTQNRGDSSSDRGLVKFDETNAPIDFSKSQSASRSPVVPNAISNAPPPPPPPPLPLAPLHGVPLLSKAAQTSTSSSPQLANLPPEPPPLAPTSALQPNQSPEEQEQSEKLANTFASSGRDALLAEIRAAASRPKSRPVRQNAVDITNDVGQNGEKLSRPSSPISDNPRDSLLASIRQAAGKPTAKKNNPTARSRHIEEKLERSKQPTSSDGGADLMSDLVNKLRARRDGISGSNEVVKTDSPNTNQTNVRAGDKSGLKLSGSEVGASVTNPQIRALNQMSSMIPAKPKESSSEEEGDVNDSDGFNDDDWS